MKEAANFVNEVNSSLSLYFKAVIAMHWRRKVYALIAVKSLCARRKSEKRWKSVWRSSSSKSLVATASKFKSIYPSWFTSFFRLMLAIMLLQNIISCKTLADF
jgi:hypothetical protein